MRAFRALYARSQNERGGANRRAQILRSAKSKLRLAQDDNC
jgi:hypothetical protein